MALPVPPSKNQPIPNNPFYYPEGNFLYGDTGHLIVGAGLSIDYTLGVISASGGGGGVSSILAGTGINVSSSTGNVTITNTGVISISTGLGLSGGPITSTGTITLSNTGVNPGNYTLANITVDAQGRISAASDGAAVLSVSGTAPVNVTTGVNPTISIAPSSTSSAGIVQLNNTLSSNSTTEALTAAQGQILQNQINSLSVATNLTFAGTFDASLAHMDSVTTEGAAEGFALGANLPAPAVSNDNFFVIVTTEGSYSPPGGGGSYAANRGDWFLSNGVTWEYLNVGSDLPVASTGSQGIVELATVAETQAGTDTALAVTPAGAAATYIPQSCLSSKGALITAAVAGTPITFPTGPNGYVLTSCSAGFYGLTWTPGACVVTQCTNPFNTTLGYCAMPGPVCAGMATNNVAIGTCAMYKNRCGFQNVAIGDYALCSLSPPPTNPIAGTNVAVGFFAMCSLCVGSQNVALGNRVADTLITGNANIAIGFGTLDATTDGSFNVAIGNNTMRCSTIVCYNTAVGSGALYTNTTGCNNVAIGNNSLQIHTTGCRNIGIGADSFSSNSTVSNEVTIWNGVVYARFQGAASSWSFVSDKRDKTEIKDLTVGLDFVKQLKPRTFEWNLRRSDVDNGKKASGFVAQEVDELVATLGAEHLNLVDKNDPDQYTLAQANLVPVLVKAIQELSAKVDELESKLAANG